MNLTLKNLAILHSQHRINDAQVIEWLKKLEYPVKRQENGETWYEGEQDNTIVAVQAMIGDEITAEDFDKFVKLLENKNG